MKKKNKKRNIIKYFPVLNIEIITEKIKVLDDIILINKVIKKNIIINFII